MGFLPELKPLRRFRLENGMTQEQFGKLLKISQGQLSRLERGLFKLSTDKLEVLQERGYNGGHDD